MICHPSWPDFWDVYDNGEWEPWTLEVVGEVTGRYVDVGAWIGPTVIAAKNASERVAVEPDPEALGMLVANLIEADCEATFVRKAVSDEAGTVTLHAPRGLSLGSSESTMLPRGGGESFEVEAVTLPSLGHAELIKIDIEGAESFVLPAAREWLDGKQPILVSLHGEWFGPREMDEIRGVFSDYSEVLVDGKPGAITDRSIQTVLAR